MAPAFRPRWASRARRRPISSPPTTSPRRASLLWELDGSRAAPPLAGAFFLGAPLAIDNTLYVMAEIRSAIYLLALDPATGQVQWQQQLVGLEQSIALDPTRRRAGATPSYAGGYPGLPDGGQRGHRDRRREARIRLGLSLSARSRNRRPRCATCGRTQAQTPVGTGQRPLARQHGRHRRGPRVSHAARVGRDALPRSANGQVELEASAGRFAVRRRASITGNVLLVGAEGVQALRVADGAAGLAAGNGAAADRRTAGRTRLLERRPATIFRSRRARSRQST